MSLFLASSDWMILLQLIFRLHSVAEEGQVPDRSLELLNLVTPYRAGVFCRAKPHGTGISITGMWANGIPEEELPALGRLLATNGFILGVCLNPSGPVMRGPGQTQFDAGQTSEALRRYVPQDMHKAVTFALYSGSQLFGFVLLWRGEQDERFNQRDVCALAYMKDHIALKLDNLTPAPSGEEGVRRRLAAAVAEKNLTNRELEVLYFTYLGLDEGEACQSLGISSSTYKKHLNHIYTKIGVNSKVKLIKFVEGAGD